MFTNYISKIKARLRHEFSPVIARQRVHFFMKKFGVIMVTPKMSLGDIDTKLEKYIDYKNGFFIEVGGNDGRTQSNTYYLEYKKNWKGMLVEAVPESFEKCKKNRPNVYVYNCALVSPDYSKSTLLIHYANLMSIGENAMSSDLLKNHIDRGRPNGLPTYSIDVPVATLESILDKISPPAIDFFSLDVEGAELEVLKGLNLKRYRPKFILIEVRNYNLITNFLQDNGYECVDQLSHHDYLYMDSVDPCLAKK